MESSLQPDNLAVFNPLSSIVLPGNRTVTTTGLILVVGPNSSGKTQLLKDIHASLLGQPRQLVVAIKVGVNKPKSFEALIEALEKEGYVRKQFDADGSEIIKIKTVSLGGSGNAFPAQLNYGIVKSWFNNITEGKTDPHAQSFYAVFGGMLSTALFLANRMTATNQTANYDYENAPPTNDLQALYYNTEARDELTRAVRETFGRGIWVDPTRGNILCFRLTDTPDLPPAEDRLRPDRVTNNRVIDDEGDGLRSFVAICMCLALSRRPVCLIDEPETCLHPPQAYALGRIIGREATKRLTTTLVATHSSHVLRGVIQQTRDVQIVRLTRSGGKFVSHLVDSELLRKATEKPMVRTEAIFDGLFADGVVLVESDGDRAVYQAVWESITQPRQLDLLFVPLNGKGPMADVAGFFKALHIPVAVIPDLDLIKDDGVIPSLLTALSIDEKTATAIQEECRVVAAAIRSVPPTISPENVNSEVNQIAEMSKDWQKNEDDAVMKRLRGLANRIDRMRKMKRGGITAYRAGHPEIADQLEAVKERFWKAGVFIVPVGELESWLSDEFMKDGPSRETKKQEWADEAAHRIRQQPDQVGAIAQFVSKVAEFIAAKEAGMG